MILWVIALRKIKEYHQSLYREINDQRVSIEIVPNDEGATSLVFFFFFFLYFFFFFFFFFLAILFIFFSFFSFKKSFRKKDI